MGRVALVALVSLTSTGCRLNVDFKQDFTGNTEASRGEVTVSVHLPNANALNDADATFIAGLLGMVIERCAIVGRA